MKTRCFTVENAEHRELPTGVPALLLILVFCGCAGAGFLAERMIFSTAKTVSTIQVAPEKRAEESEPRPPAQRVEALKWSLLASNNYEQYVSNLRAVRCPEATIRSILRGEVLRAFAPRLEKIAASTALMPQGARMRERYYQRAAVDKEIDSIIYERLQLPRPIRSPGPLFNAEQEARIAEANRLFPKAMPAGANREDAQAAALTNQEARVHFLASYLTPRQLTYYRLDREGQAEQIARWLYGMQPSEEEFLRVAEATERTPLSSSNGEFNPESLAALASALSPERLAWLQAIQKAPYRNILDFGRRYRLSQQAVVALLNLRRDVFGRDEASYRQQVAVILRRPDQLAEYLSNGRIHLPSSP